MAAPGSAPRWRSRTTFVLALSASAVSLGNLWRFSYLSGEYGGAPFVLTYVACLFFIAVPVMVAEVVLGCHGRAGPLESIRHACDRSLRSRGWVALGGLACLAGLLFLALYSVVAGWSLAYARFMYSGMFSAAPIAEVGEQFARLLHAPAQQIYWQSLFLLLTVGVVSLGVRRGLGLLVWLAVPALLALLGTLIRFGLEHGDVEAAGAFLFAIRPVDFTPGAALTALGHAFYTLGVGVATGICYGAYAPAQLPVARSVLAVAVFDTVVSLFAGLAIFPIVLANHMEPAAGPGLLFVSLPYAFGNLAQGDGYGTLFFLLVVLATLGSAVAVLEPLVAALRGLLRVERVTAALLAGGAAWLLGLAVVLAFDPEATRYAERNLFQWLDWLTAAVLLPLVALLTAIFVGWRLRPQVLRRYLAREPAGLFGLWRFLLRFVAPPAIAILLLASLLS